MERKRRRVRWKRGRGEEVENDIGRGMREKRERIGEDGEG